MMKRYNSITRQLFFLYLSALLLAPVALLILPADFFDKGQSICLSVLLFDQPCYGCGMTRAIQHLIHFDIESAMHFNKLSLIVAPVLLTLWTKEIYRMIEKIQAAYSIYNRKNYKEIE